MPYTLAHWLLFFFTYAFLGWVWEVALVSFQQRKWVNRGFLIGPFLPIYGFGALIILLSTLAVRDEPLQVFVLGMVAATILEYVAGALIEKLFHVRYWDYSTHRFNINGYISPLATLGWGALAVMLVKVMHPQVARLILRLPTLWSEILSLILTTYLAVDTTRSVQAALDIKEMLARLTESNEQLAQLVERFNAIMAKVAAGSQDVQVRLEQLEIKLKPRENAGPLGLLKEKSESALQEVQSRLKAARGNNEQSRWSALLEQLHELTGELRQFEFRQAVRKARKNNAAFDLLRRNPSSSSNRFKEALEELKQHLDSKDK